MSWIPVWIKYDDGICSSEIQTDATSFSGRQEYELVAILVELSHEQNSLDFVCFPVKSAVIVALGDYVLFYYVQQLK